MIKLKIITLFVSNINYDSPCLNTKAAKKTLFEECSRRDYYVRIKITIEDGVRGVRVWRLK